ncbi:MAG: TlyA family rRNA (cytidine-2'-O)-methyltransferase [Firmicutes bacterium HGW-Firmicutes-15]|nr:MAG: TlyA family rRNA (cytidine-2'-O)-methyltransferase [Firmicutes bacterium HGW-Firmicutes-15]
MAKVRLDTLIHSQGLVSSREKAQAMIIAGEVWVNGNRIDKPGTKVDEKIEIHIQSRRIQYVSRGGFKLEGAIQDFNIDFQAKVVLDVGASTGGYTDCALQNGAAKIFAVDVGYGQLDWSLRNDPRVVVFERTNIRYFTPENLGELVDIITMDVSFISTTIIFPVLTHLLKEDGKVISLIKPQFEAGREKVGKKGVVKDPAVHREVLLRCIAAAGQSGLNCVGISYSPIKGPEGNIEYFIYLVKKPEPLEQISEKVAEVVLRAHDVLEGKAK